MRKYIFLSMFIVVAILAIAIQGFSAETKAKTKTKASTTSTRGTFNMTGDITRVRGSEITISTKLKTVLMFIVDNNTSISKSGKSIKITDIKNGDSVDVTYEKKGDKNIAKYIYVQENYPTYPVKSKNR